MRYRNELGIIMNNSSIVSNTENNDVYLSLDSKGNQQGTYIIRKGERWLSLPAKVPE